MSAWTKLTTPLARKLEMKRRALVRRKNRARRHQAALDLLASTPSSALAFPRGLK